MNKVIFVRASVKRFKALRRSLLRIQGPLKLLPHTRKLEIAFAKFTG